MLDISARLRILISAKENIEYDFACKIRSTHFSWNNMYTYHLFFFERACCVKALCDIYIYIYIVLRVNNAYKRKYKYIYISIYMHINIYILKIYVRVCVCVCVCVHACVS